MNNVTTPPLKLRVGDIVEVRSQTEILSTLDDQGNLDGMPFMPEMLQYCGKRFRVDKRADKTCNTITIMESRRLYDTVHLEGLRCTGDAHGYCQAQCFLFWKEGWLRRVGDWQESSGISSKAPEPRGSSPLCGKQRLEELTQNRDVADGSEIHYRCQATDLLKASESLPWWDFRQYIRDVRCGNIGVLDLLKAALLHFFKKTIRITAYRAQIQAYNHFQSWRGGTAYPFRWGTLDKTPAETLGLRPGDLVQIKSHDEILKTLNTKNKNLGLRFDAEMVPYCGSTQRVRARVERIIDERSGKMLTFANDCLILDNVICRARYSERRMFCPRGIYPYWREIWLKRVEENPPAQSLSAAAEVTQNSK